MPKANPVPRLWPGSTIVCLGCGPSLSAADVDYCRGKARVIAINDSYRLAPWADALFACDARWWRQHPKASEFAGLRFSLSADVPPGVHRLIWEKRHGLSTDPAYLSSGHNSGHQAINLAVHLGAKRVVLLGFDMSAPSRRKTHFHGDHPAPLKNPRDSDFAEWLTLAATLVEPLAALGVQIVNCSRKTALTCFPTARLEDIEWNTGLPSEP